MLFNCAIILQTQAGPSPNALFQFQKDNRSHPWLHITADSGMVERKVLEIDPVGLHGLSTPDGVRLPESITWDRVIAGPEGLDELRVDRHGHERDTDATLPARITWNQVDRIEMHGGSALQGGSDRRCELRQP